MKIQHNTTQIKSNKEIRLPSVQDSPLCGGDFEHNSGEYCVVVDVPLDWPMAKDAIAPYTPPPEDYYRVVEASLGIRVSKLGVLAKREIERIYFDGLCGKARGYTKKESDQKAAQQALKRIKSDKELRNGIQAASEKKKSSDITD